MSESALTELDHPADEPRPPCFDCGPGYRLGDDGCQHGKVCTKCKQLKPSDETGFYRDRRSIDRLSSWCRRCMNSVPKAQTRARIIRNRARHRASQMLIDLHAEEFGALYERCRAEAEEEDERLNADPQIAARFDGKTPRLRTGPRRGEPETRVDETWCSSCVAYHATNHHAGPNRRPKTVAESFEEFNAGTARAAGR